MPYDPIPIARLIIECAVINPPKPLGIAVQVGGKIIATVSLEDFKEAAARLAALEAASSPPPRTR
jgi:hypothetical protein